MMVNRYQILNAYAYSLRKMICIFSQEIYILDSSQEIYILDRGHKIGTCCMLHFFDRLIFQYFLQVTFRLTPLTSTAKSNQILRNTVPNKVKIFWEGHEIRYKGRFCGLLRISELYHLQTTNDKIQIAYFSFVTLKLK